jgi:glycosyltransferase involved in cell wall biosynthesis
MKSFKDDDTKQKSSEKEQIDILKILQEKDEQIASLQKALANSQELIVNIHQSLPLRVFRTYDSSLGKILPLRLKKKIQSSTSKPKSVNSSHIKEILSDTAPDKKDILFFPMINWDYRRQRPHHISRKFANNGHRVFYLTPTLRHLDNFFEIDHLETNIYELELSSPKYFDIYKDKIDDHLLKSLGESFTKLQNELKLDAISIVAFPTWTPLALLLRKLFGFKIMFDHVDAIQEFPNINKERKKEEHMLLQNSDLVITSASHLFQKAQKINKNTILIPNAGDYALFSGSTKDQMLQDFQKPIIGYFGAIAEWFDTDLIEYVAKNRPNLTFVFIGDTYGSNLKKIRNLNNVYFLGERPYTELPKYLYYFDVCLIPFKLTSLILNSHPIKIYEYLAAGKPVITTEIPDLASMGDLCYIAEDKTSFLEKLDKSLKENDRKLIEKRIEFASKNTWQDRFQAIYSELEKNSFF